MEKIEIEKKTLDLIYPQTNITIRFKKPTRVTEYVRRSVFD